MFTTCSHTHTHTDSIKSLIFRCLFVLFIESANTSHFGITNTNVLQTTHHLMPYIITTDDYLFTHTCTHAQPRMHAHTHAYTHTCTHTHTHTHLIFLSASSESTTLKDLRIRAFRIS